MGCTSIGSWLHSSFGRPLNRDEDAHHVNGKKLDLSIENIKVMGHREHGCVTAKQHFYIQQHDIKTKSEWDDYFEQERIGGGGDVSFP